MYTWDIDEQVAGSWGLTTMHAPEKEGEKLESVIVREWISGWSRMGGPTLDQGLTEPLTYCVVLDTGSLSLVLQKELGLKDS